MFLVDFRGLQSDHYFQFPYLFISINQFAANYADQDALRWGLIIGPKSAGDVEQLVVVADILPFDQFCFKVYFFYYISSSV